MGLQALPLTPPTPMTPTDERLVKISWHWYGGIGHYRVRKEEPLGSYPRTER
jgi:hypothetical protein